MKAEEFKTIVIKAEEGKFLTQKAAVDISERAVTPILALGRNDSIDNWKEISAEEANTILEQQAALMAEEEALAEDII